MGLIDALGSGPVAIDTAPFVYFIEKHPKYLPILKPLFQKIDAQQVGAVTSAISLIEVLVVPYRSHDSALAARYEKLLTRSRGLRLFELSLPLLRAAAKIRASTGLKTPDALQIAAAVSGGCTAVLTNDDRWPSDMGGLRILQLDRHLA